MAQERMEAPGRIWATTTGNPGYDFRRRWHQSSVSEFATEYVRADLFATLQAQQAETVAANAVLVDRLTEAMGHIRRLLAVLDRDNKRGIPPEDLLLAKIAARAFAAAPATDKQETPT